MNVVMFSGWRSKTFSTKNTPFASIAIHYGPLAKEYWSAALNTMQPTFQVTAQS